METLNDVLAIHKIEEGKLVLNMQPFHIVDLVSHAKAVFRSVSLVSVRYVVIGMAVEHV